MMKLKKVAFMILVGVIIISSAGCTEKTNNDSASNYKVERQENWTSINDDIFVSTGDHNKVNMVLVKSNDEVALIDTGCDEKQALRVKEYIEKNNLLLKNIILTHMHDDQKRNLNMFKEKDVKVTTPFGAKDNQVITVGDKTLKILHTPGHCDNKHFSVEIDGEILVAGDIVTTDEATQICITHDECKALIATLEKLRDKDYSLVIPGHGDVCEDASIISKTLEEKTNQLSKHSVVKEVERWIAIDDEIFVSVSNYLMTNMVLVTSGNEGILIDTGYKLPEAKAVQKYIEDNDITLKNIILTHRHYDHDSNVDMFLDDDIKLFEYDNSNDNQVIEMGDKKLRIIFTPGHAANKHLSVEINDKVLIAGDVILSSINIIEALKGDGDKDALIKTLEGLKEKNYTLIIPGHGDICIGDSILYEHVQTLKKCDE